MLLEAELEELTGDINKKATGVIIESHRDDKRGIATTMIIKNGTIKLGQYVVSGGAMSSVRIMEDFLGNKIESATFSSPISLTEFDNIPEVGSAFTTYENKKDATLARSAYKNITANKKDIKQENGKFVMPIIIKADTLGSLEAIEFELSKIENDFFVIKILDKGVGSISEGELKTAITTKDTVIIGFNTHADLTATEVARQHNIIIKNFSIIYELTN